MPEFGRAIRETPQRMADAWCDPVRRRQSAGRIAESYLPTAAMLGVLGVGWTSFVWGLLVVAAEFLFFEWLLEPLGIAGAYWERGPRDGETFRRP